MTVKGAYMKDLILTHALKLCAAKGFRNVTRDNIAASAGVATGSVSYHLGDTRKLRAAIVAHAIEQKDLTVIAQAYADQHPLAVKADPDLVARAVRHMARKI